MRGVCALSHGMTAVDGSVRSSRSAQRWSSAPGAHTHTHTTPRIHAHARARTQTHTRGARSCRCGGTLWPASAWAAAGRRRAIADSYRRALRRVVMRLHRSPFLGTHARLRTHPSLQLLRRRAAVNDGWVQWRAEVPHAHASTRTHARARTLTHSHRHARAHARTGAVRAQP